MDANATQFEKADDPGTFHDRPDHRQELRLMARRNGWDEADLFKMRDVQPAWNTKTGRPIGSAPVNPHVTVLPAWYPSSAR